MLELAERLRSFDARLNRIINNSGGSMTVGGQATAIAMLVTLDLNLFEEAANALANGGNHG
jgi:hypothetical protein